MNLKKGIALALTAAALLAFTGCGSNGTTSNGEYKVGVVQLVEQYCTTFRIRSEKLDFSNCYASGSIHGECNS